MAKFIPRDCSTTTKPFLGLYFHKKPKLQAATSQPFFLLGPFSLVPETTIVVYFIQFLAYVSKRLIGSLVNFLRAFHFPQALLLRSHSRHLIFCLLFVLFELFLKISLFAFYFVNFGLRLLKLFFCLTVLLAQELSKLANV